MIGWRRKARAERARLENPMSAENLYTLVNQTLLANFGPLGSYAITRRAPGDSDDIFHTMLASSVAHDIVSTLMTHEAVPVRAEAPSLRSVPVSEPVPVGSFVGATSAFAASHALPAAPLVAPQKLAALVPDAASTVAATPSVHGAPSPFVETFSATPSAVAADIEASAPVAAVAVASARTSATPASTPAPAPLAPIDSVPVSAELAAALTVLDETGAMTLPQPVAAASVPFAATR